MYPITKEPTVDIDDLATPKYCELHPVNVLIVHRITTAMRDVTSITQVDAAIVAMVDVNQVIKAVMNTRDCGLDYSHATGVITRSVESVRITDPNSGNFGDLTVKTPERDVPPNLRDRAAKRIVSYVKGQGGWVPIERIQASTQKPYSFIKAVVRSSAKLEMRRDEISVRYVT